MYDDDPTLPRPVDPRTPVDPYGYVTVHPGYGTPLPAGPAPAPVRGTNAMAILSLVFAFLFWPLAIVFGHVGKRQIERTQEGGSGLATAGLVIAYLQLVLTMAVCCAGAYLIGDLTGDR